MAPDPVAELVGALIGEDTLTGATLSKPRRVDPSGATKITIDPVDVRAGARYRWRHHHPTRTIDETLTAEETANRLGHLLGGAFRQGLLRSADADYQVLAGGKAPRILRRPPSRATASRTHDRVKQRILPDGVAVPFLVELGVMTAAGAVRAQRQDKFRQVNRFLELVEDVLPSLPEGQLRVVDFGSGRSYLTFAVHHLLTVVHGREVEILGLDLKEDVVAECEGLARRLGADGLRFELGDIASAPVSGADLVVSLHACDTATDAALARAVQLGAKVILAVPCCQHELLGQLADERLEPLLRYGVLRERFAAEVTDAARARLLALCGFDVQLMELFELEHSPKNVLLRATRLDRPRPALDTAQLAATYRTFADGLAIEPMLERLLADELPGWEHPAGSVSTVSECATTSAAAGESLAGTGMVASRWLCVESSSAWGRDAIVDGGFSAELSTWLQELDAGVLAIRRPGRRVAATTVFSARTSEDGGELRRLELAAADELVGSDPWSGGVPVETTLFLVCAHGRRDRCCSRLGVPIFTALDRLVEHAWECSHTGGHRFAPNIVALPWGATLGRVQRDEVSAIAAMLSEGRVPLNRYRGRSIYSAPVQAAEVALRLAHDIGRLDDLRLVRQEDDIVVFEHARGAELAMRVELRKGPYLAKSCGAEPEQLTMFTTEEIT